MINRKWNQALRTIGKIFVDLGKITYGSLIIGSLIKGDFDPLYIFIFGVVAATLFFVVGILLISQTEE